MSAPAYHLRGVLGKDFLRCVCLANNHGEDDAVGLELGLSENKGDSIYSPLKQLFGVVFSVFRETQ